MSVEQKIVTLCDRWWTELSHSKSEPMKPVAAAWLGLLGWETGEPIYLEGAACGFAVESGLGQCIVFYFTLPGELETPSVLIEKGLDYCETTLMLVGEAQLEQYDYVVISDLNRSYVYDAKSDELLLYSDSPMFFVRDVMPDLLKEQVDLGALDEIRRDPGSTVARQLRVWSQRWATVMSREPYGSEGVADTIMDRVLVLRYLYDHSICESPNWSFKLQFRHVISAAYEESPANARRAMLRLMDDMHRIWQSDMFAPDDSVRRIITRSVVMVEMIQELALMAKNKFTLSSILESFNFGEASEKARVRLVPEPNEDRELWLSGLTVADFGKAKLELDVLEEGYRVIPHWFDRLVKTVTRISREHDLSKVLPECMVTSPDFGQDADMDLFSWTEEQGSGGDAAKPNELDVLSVCLGRLFLVWAASERQHRTARIVLLLHLIELYESGGYPFGVFPAMDHAIADRPSMLQADKAWVYQGRSEPGEEWDVV